MAQTKVKLISDGVIDVDHLASGHGITTDNIGEGSNLYYTDARVSTYLSTNSYATEGYVTTAVANLVDSAPTTLDTLNELAAALGDDPNFATTVTNSIATKLPLAGGTLTGALTVNGDITSSANEGKLILNSTATNGKQYQFISIDTGNFGLYDGTAYRLWVGGNGNVGIGTTSPSSKLHVAGTIYTSAGNYKLDSGLEVTWGNGNTSILGNTSSNFLDFRVNNTARMIIANGGNVGIGTTSPDEKLHVNGNIAAINSSYPTIKVQGSDVNYQGRMRWDTNNNVLEFLTRHAGTYYGDTLVLKEGKVGIGTNAPVAKFQVSDGNNNADIGDLQGNSTMSLRMHDNAFYPVEVQAYSTELRFNTASSSGATPTVKMMISGGGYIGIGTTSPDDKLHVDNGGLRISTTANSNHLSIKNIQTSTASTAFEKKIRFLGYNNVEEASIVGLGNQYWGSAYNGLGFNIGTTRRLTINNSGDVNIGNGSNSGSLYFENDVKTRKIVLYSGAGNDNEFYGFGVESNTLVYSTYTANDDHVFFSGYSGGRNELMRVRGVGNVDISGENLTLRGVR